MLIGLILLFALNAALVHFLLYGRAFWRSGSRLFSVGWTTVVTLILVFCEIRMFAVPFAALKYLFH